MTVRKVVGEEGHKEKGGRKKTEVEAMRVPVVITRPFPWPLPPDRNWSLEIERSGPEDEDTRMERWQKEREAQMVEK